MIFELTDILTIIVLLFIFRAVRDKDFYVANDEFIRLVDDEKENIIIGIKARKFPSNRYEYSVRAKGVRIKTKSPKEIPLPDDVVSLKEL